MAGSLKDLKTIFFGRSKREEFQHHYDTVVEPADIKAIATTEYRKSLEMYEWEQKATKAVQINGSTWKQPQMSTYNYEKAAREAYGGNEIFYACVEALCQSASEAKWKVIGHDDKPLPDDHPVHKLLDKPNPFLTGYNFTASMIMFRSLAGNVFIEKIFSNGGDLVEMWLIRPDRMSIIPGATAPIGYKFQFGQYSVDYPLEEIGHWKTKNLLDQFWGMPPIMPLLSRIDTDNFAREFTKAFFYNAGVPSTLISFKEALEDQEREMMKSKFRSGFNGPAGWHDVIVAEANTIEVKPLGLPLGSRGIAYPDLDEIEEARIAMVMGVPLTIIGARLGQLSSSYANRMSDRDMFWKQTLIPMYVELQSEYNQWLVPHFPDVKRIEADYESVMAFSADTDLLQTRWRNNMSGGLSAWREARAKIGLHEDPEDDDLIFVPTGMRPVLFSEFKNGQGFWSLTEKLAVTEQGPTIENPDADPSQQKDAKTPLAQAPQRPVGAPMVPGQPNSNAKGNE